MDLASKGMPSGGSVGYEIFDKGDSLSATSFVQGVNALRALEGELARTIRSLSRVQSGPRPPRAPRAQALRARPRAPARLHRAEGCVRDSTPARCGPSAISSLPRRGPEARPDLDRRRTRTSAGRRRPGRTEAARPRFDEKQHAFRKPREAAGRGHRGQRRRPGPHAHPGLRRARHQPRPADVRDLRSREPGRPLHPDPQREPGHHGSGDGAGHRRQRTARRHRRGRRAAPSRTPRTSRGDRQLRDLQDHAHGSRSKAAASSGSRLPCSSTALRKDRPTARSSYQPRPQDELDRIAALVRSSMGFDAKRGDQIEVVNLRFAEAPLAGDAAPAIEPGPATFLPMRDDIMRGVEAAPSFDPDDPRPVGRGKADGQNHPGACHGIRPGALRPAMCKSRPHRSCPSYRNPKPVE